MIIGLDFTWVSPQNQSGGVYQYGMRILDALVQNTDNAIVAIGNEGNANLFEHLKKQDNFKFVIKSDLSFLTPIVEKEHLEVVHTPIQHHLNYTLAAPMVNTLHDLQPFHFPEYFSLEEIESRNLLYKKSAEFSERVIVSYQHVKDDVVKFYNIPHDKIDVCSHGMAEAEKVLPTEINKICLKYKLPTNYLLYSANTWRHKNHIGLIKALKVLDESYGLKMTLVCTGFQNPDFFPQIEEEVRRLGLSDWVRFLGYLPEDEMPAILSGATLSVIPTFYEAGSFPLMEAMNFGVPVICSSATSLPDTIGDPRFVFDPASPGDIAEKIAMMLTNQRMRKINLENSASRIRGWRWEQAVKPFLASYERAIEDFGNKKKNRWYYDWALNYEFMSLRLESKLRRELSVYTSEITRFQSSMNSSCNKVKAIENSLSWRITAPLRKALDLFRRR